MQDVRWNQEHLVYVNRELSIALVKVRRGQYMEFDDYREDGGNTLRELPPYTELVGTFTNAEISNMEYPE